MPANNNDLLLNGIVASSDHHAIVNVSSSQNAHGETSILQLLDSQKLLKMACTPNGTQTAYWVKGKGDIAFGNDMMSSSDSSQLYLIATRNNVIQWKELIEQNGIVSDQTSMVWPLTVIWFLVLHLEIPYLFRIIPISVRERMIFYYQSLILREPLHAVKCMVRCSLKKYWR